MAVLLGVAAVRPPITHTIGWVSTGELPAAGLPTRGREGHLHEGPPMREPARTESSMRLLKWTVFVVVLSTILTIAALPWVIREATVYLASH